MRQMKDSGIEWIGDIPESWKVLFAFQCFSQVKNKNEGLSETNLLSLSYGKLKRKSMDTTEGLLPESFESYNIIEANDIVLRLTDLQNDHTSLRVGLSEERGIITSAYVTLRNYSKNVPKYLYYYLHSYDIAKGFYGMGAGVRQGLNWEGLKHLKMLAPTPQEQQKISTYLDRQCGLIDSVIEKTKASVEEYKKLRQAVITQAVTKGVRGDRPMKDSGVEFIGNIPANWEIERLKFILSEIVDCPHETPNYSPDGEYLVIRTADEDYGFLRSTENMYRLDKAEYENRTRRLLLEKDDIVYGREGERWGLACLVPESNKYCLGQRMMQFRCRKNIVYPLFLKWALNSINVYLQGRFDTIGSTSPHVNISTIINFKIPIPELEEQIEVANYAEKKSNEINVLISKKEQFLTELESYKKSLIYEYVTGKKEVPQA